MTLISPVKLNIADKLEKDKKFRKRFFRGQAQDKIAMDIRELRKKVSFRPYEGKFKVIFLYRVEDMTSGAANSFLKTLEEPTEATVFILVSHNFNLLLPTIIWAIMSSFSQMLINPP